MPQFSNSSDNNTVERKFTLNLTPTDAGSAFRFHYQRHFFSIKNLVISLTLFAFAAATSVLPSSDELLKILFFLVSFFIIQFTGFALFSAVYLLIVANWMGRRYFSQQLSLHEPMLIFWDDNGLKTESKSMSSFTPWDNYRIVAENNSIVLLYQSDLMFQFLPKRALSASQIADLRSYAGRFVAASRR